MNLKQAIDIALSQMSQSELEQMGSSLSNLTQSLRPFMETVIMKSHPIRIETNFNMSIQPEDMERNSIYLDGACRGYHQDHQKNSISFDHHVGCVRFITLATCQQVYRAIQLGFNPLDYCQIIIDDIDGDTVLSCFVLRNPEIVLNEEHPYHQTLKEVVEAVGIVDSIGAVTQKPHPIHHVINPKRHIARTHHLFWQCYDKLECFIKGELSESDLPEEDKVVIRYYGIDPETGEVDDLGMTATPMEQMYQDAPIVLAVQTMHEPLPFNDDSARQTNYTLGKKSDFIKGDFQKVFQKLREMELMVSEAPELITKNWGGADTIGGSAWYKNGTHSRLPTELVLETILKNL